MELLAKHVTNFPQTTPLKPLHRNLRVKAMISMD